jgi:hypothetical protein
MSNARNLARLIVDSGGDVDASAFNNAPTGRNRIINGDMRISQRGDYTSATAIPTSGTYYLDRFKCRRNGVTGTFTHKLNQTLGNNNVVNTLRFDVTSTTTGRVELSQIIEDFNWFKNKTITFSAQVKSNSTNARLVFNADGGGGSTASTAHTGGGEWELLTGTATLTSGVTGVQIYAGIQGAGTGDAIGVTSGDYFEISEIQIEAGSVATPFEHRQYGQELALCQRYFYRMSGNDALQDSYQVTQGFTMGIYWFPVTMRATPTLTSTITSASNQYSGSPSVASRGNHSLYFLTRAAATGRTYAILSDSDADAGR